MIAMLALIGALGLACGSFLTVVVHRVPLAESIVSPRSRCPGCGVEVSARDNVPVLSWLWLRGRCRHCAEPIHWRYPALELGTGLAFLLVALVCGLELDLIYQLPFLLLLIATAMIDLGHRKIPNRIVYPAAGWALIASALVDPSRLPEALASGAGAFAFLLLAALAYPGGMGMGDVKLAGAMGLFLGLPVMVALGVAFLTGSVLGLGLMAVHGAKARKQKVPFGPFLALGGFVALLAGADLIDLYADAFLSG